MIDFIWKPYTTYKLEEMPAEFRVGDKRRIGFEHVLLIMFVVVEYYVSIWTARQFYRIQMIPPVRAMFDPLHDITRRGRAVHDWIGYHRVHLDHWEHLELHLEFGQHQDDSRPCTAPGYDVWYYRIIRQRIAPPKIRHSGYVSEVFRAAHGLRDVIRIHHIHMIL
ncbi:hypothetical protein Droror1_Dr00022623 [Drosera rotundifolia]